MGSRRMEGWVAAVVAVGVVGMAGCGREPGVEDTAPPAWALTLEIDGQPMSVPLEIMNVFLVEDESENEIFEILGDGVALVGEIPAAAQVGYGERWEALFDRGIPLHTSGGDVREPKQAFVQLPGRGSLRVLGGEIFPEGVSGKMQGIEGDRTLSGRVELRVETDAGPETLRGTFAVHCVTWG
jgi:hypothetical protein